MKNTNFPFIKQILGTGIVPSSCHNIAARLCQWPRQRWIIGSRRRLIRVACSECNVHSFNVEKKNRY